MLSIPCCLSRMALDLTIPEIKLQLFTVHTEIADNKDIWSLKAKQAISIEHNDIRQSISIKYKGLTRWHEKQLPKTYSGQPPNIKLTSSAYH